MSFWKQEILSALLEAFDKGSAKDLCKALVCSAMDENNLVKTETKICYVIADLTGRDVRRIQEALQLLHDEGFGVWEERSFRVNKIHASKTRQRLIYAGNHPQYSDAAWQFQKRFDIVFPCKQYPRKAEDDEMSPAMQKRFDELSDQNERLSQQNQVIMRQSMELKMLSEELKQLVISMAASGTVNEVKEKAERHLRSVPNPID